MPDLTQKESAQSDHPALRKRAKCGRILQFWTTGKISQIFSMFWRFSLMDSQIELSPFALSQASWDTSLDYPQQVFWRQKISTIPPLYPSWGNLKKMISVKKNTFLMDLLV